MPNDMYCVKKRNFLVLNFYLKLPLEVMAISVLFIFVNELNKYVFFNRLFSDSALQNTYLRGKVLENAEEVKKYRIFFFFKCRDVIGFNGK